MIEDVIRRAWADSPTRVVLAILATPVVVVLGWALTAVAIVLGQP